MSDWEKKTFPDGRTFVSSDVLTHGDYCNSGSVGAANVRVLREQHKHTTEDVGSTAWRIGNLEKDGWTDYVPDPDTTLIVVYWPYSTEQAWLIENEDTADTINGLDDYPLIDEEAMSEVEAEWENEAWSNWLKSDLIREVCKTIEDFDETADRLSDDQLFECYRQAMDSTNTYPVAESSGVHVDVERIADAFAENVHNMQPEAK